MGWTHPERDPEFVDLRLLGANLVADQCLDDSGQGLNDMIRQAGSEFGVDAGEPVSGISGWWRELSSRPDPRERCQGDAAIADAFLDPVLPVDCDPEPPTCQTDATLCPPDPTCETDTSLCSPEPRDTRAPQTRVTKKVRLGKRSVKFVFRSSEKGSKFKCSLDGRKFSRCKSPKKLKRLKKGKHTFRVRATDRAGNVDKTPAKRTFRIRR